MSHITTVLLNDNCGIYEHGIAFSRAKWIDIVRRYDDMVNMNGAYTIRQLTVLTSTSISLAAKAITYHQSGLIIYPTKERGNTCKRS